MPARLRWLIGRRRFEREMGEELRFHLDRRAEDLRRSGLTPAEAERQARLEFGATESYKEQCREAGGLRLLDELRQDLRYAARTLRRNPGLAAVAILSLALGIGANSALFSLFDALMLKSLPVEKPAELYSLREVSRIPSANRFSYPLFQKLNQAASDMAAMSRIANDVLLIDGEAQPEQAKVQLVSGGYFDVLGVYSRLGRLFTPEDNRTLGGHPVAVISAGFWKRRFAESPAVLGRGMSINGVHFTIVGVAARGFSGVWAETPVDIWVPVMMQPEIRYAQNFSSADSDPNQPWPPQDRIRWLDLVLRVRAADRPAVAGRLNGVFQQEVARYAASIGDPAVRRLFVQRRLVLDAFGRGFSSARVEFAAPLYVLMAMVGLVLLIACANIANLLLARAAGRQREIAVRLSIGAGRFRLIRQLLTESVLLATLGGLFGLLVAQWSSRLLIRMGTPPALAAGLSWHVLGFTAFLCVATGLLFGLAPAVRTTRVELASTLKTGSRGLLGGSRWSLARWLVAAQVALSLLLLVGAGLFLRSLRNLSRVDSGFDREHLLSVRLDPHNLDLSGPPLWNLYQRLIERVEAIPGVRSATVAVCALSVDCRSFSDGIAISGYQPRAGEQVLVQENIVGPNYFATVGIPLTAGRDFEAHDNREAPRVAIINQAFVRRYFAGRRAVGQRFGNGKPDTEIIGVVRDARVTTVQQAAVPMAWYSLRQGQVPIETIDVRTVADPRWSASAIREALVEVDPRLPIRRVTTASDHVAANLNPERLVALLTTAFGALALGLACFGLYGVMSYAVARRTSELGVRIALGASRASVLRNVVGEALVLVGVGLAVGLPIAMAAARLVSGMLYGRRGTDPLTVAGAILVLSAVAAAAALAPALRAARVDPIRALRYE